MRDQAGRTKDVIAAEGDHGRRDLSPTVRAEKSCTPLYRDIDVKIAPLAMEPGGEGLSVGGVRVPRMAVACLNPGSVPSLE